MLHTFEYRSTNGEVKGMVLGTRRVIEEGGNETTVFIFDDDDRVVAVFTLEEGEDITEIVPEPQTELPVLTV